MVGDEGWPYAIPMHYTVMDGQIYLHCAKTGYKLDAIARDDRVCFTHPPGELVQDHATSLYESVVVLGRAALVTGQATHSGRPGPSGGCPGPRLPRPAGPVHRPAGQNTAVLVIRPIHLTGKAKRDFRPIQQRM